MKKGCLTARMFRNRETGSVLHGGDSLAELVHAASLQCVWLLVTPWAHAGCAHTELGCGVSVWYEAKETAP